MDLALRGKEPTLLHQVSGHAAVFVPFAHTRFVQGDTAHVAKISLGLGGIYLAEQHPPQPRVGLADQRGDFAHGQFAHEQQGEGRELCGEVRAQPFPRRRTGGTCRAAAGR